MCGRFAIAEPEKIQARFDTENNITFTTPLFNIAPGFIVPVITKNSPKRIRLMKWGLVPSWAKDPKIGYSMINARDDSLLSKNSYKILFKEQRCLVPASGFFEWVPIDKKIKEPYYFKRYDDEMVAFAGLYDIWKDAENKAIETFTIVTTDANDVVKPIHDRMPVILESENETSWLDKETPVGELVNMLKPYKNDLLMSYVVSHDVNSPRNNTEELIKPI